LLPTPSWVKLPDPIAWIVCSVPSASIAPEDQTVKVTKTRAARLQLEVPVANRPQVHRIRNPAGKPVRRLRL
jgi:hypothetical protein